MAQGRWLRGLNLLALLGLIVATAGLLLRPSDDDGLLGLPQLVVGGRAARTVKAPRDFALADPETTARLRAEASAAVKPIYDVDTTAGLSAKTRIERAFADAAAQHVAAAPAGASGGGGGSAKEPAIDRTALDGFMRALELYLDDLEVETVVHGGFADTVRDGAIMVVRTIHEQRIVDDRDLLRVQAPDGLVLRNVDPAGTLEHEEALSDLRSILGVDQAKATIDEVVVKHLGHLTREERRSVALLAKRLLRPNTTSNPDETTLRRMRAEEAVREVIIPIKRGEVLLRAGETVTARHLLIVQGMAAALEAESRYQRPIGSALLAALLVVLAYRQARGRFRPAPRDLGLMTAAYLMTLLFTWLAYKGAVVLGELMPSVPSPAWRALVPIATGPLLLRFLIGRAPAEAFAMLAAVTTGLMMDASLDHTILVLAGGLAATLVPVDSERPRLGVLAGGLLIGLVEVAAVSAIALLGSRWTLDVVLVESGFALASGLVAAVLVLLTTPLADVLFGYSTPVRMRDLSSLNHPLLRDLLVQAPGTYHHSIVVGALAEAGARAIGADPVLARVGGYYHDIGKLKNPRLFLENQRPAVRAGEGGPFVELSPVVVEDEGTIRAHVADGLEVGARHRLGAAVLEIIVQHHGTRELRVLGRGRLSGRPEPASLRYPGPVPLSREAALVMLADGVEAAADALLAAAPIEDGMLEATVARVVHEAIDEGQLVACPVTLADLAAVQEEMVRVLREMLTRRGGSTSVRFGDPAAPVFVVPTAGGRPN